MDFQPTPNTTESTDILLINPDFSKNEMGVFSAPENHLGLNRIAGYLKQKGKTSQIIDTTGRPESTNGPEELGDWLTDHADGYRTIGFHVNSWNINHILRTLDKARTVLKDKKLLFGGPLPSSEPLKLTELLIEKGLTDFGVVQGLGEKITDEILSKNQLHGIDGLWAYENGELQKGHKVTLTSDELEALPFLDLEHNTFYQNYYKPVIESEDLGVFDMGLIFASQGLEVNRGCPFNCTYCSVPQYEEKLMTFSPKRVVDELEYLAKEAGFFMFTFTNSNIMFLNEEWIREFCREVIGRGMDNYINWTAYHHPSIIGKLDVSDYNLMRKAGSDTIVFGIQSFEEKILKLFMRPLNTKKLTEIIRDKTRQAKQELTVDYITGVPGEDLDVIEQAFKYFSDNDIECRNYQLKFYPNTKLPTMNLDLSDYDLIPITGNLAPELEAYAVVNKTPNPRSAELDAFIRQSNARVLKNRPPRLGKYVIDSEATARQLLETEIPNNPNIPNKVKRAMTIALKEMLQPKKRTQGMANMDPAEMMRVVITAGDDAPPVVKAMQEKLKKEIGAEKFEEMKKQYS
ncbi:B12-binding domain-containing radical SAM protein [Patescibacteria group bacterium]|nr:B12-binding domain-containing radical SAM protein [Patescibacteria group bacterium]